MSINFDGPSDSSGERHLPLKQVYPGQVIANDDPKVLGRVKVEIPGLSKGIKVEDLPWYHVMQQPGLGASTYSWTTWAVPQVNTQVFVTFPTADLFSGIVTGSFCNRVTIPDDKLNLCADYIHPKSSENHFTANWDNVDDTKSGQKHFSSDMTEDYPFSWGWVSNAMTWFKENMMKRTVEFVHNSFSKMKIYYNGDTVIHITGNLKLIIEKDFYIEVRGHEDHITFNNKYEHIIGNHITMTEQMEMLESKRGMTLNSKRTTIN